ncbi:MAG: iron chelate uptake ABC transporter family permease subunit [Pseudomonadota bacterium]
MKGALVLTALLAALSMLSILWGEVRVPPGDLWRGLITGEGPGALTVRVLRGPRLATALGAGAALGLSGAIFQTLLRNPLAAPDVMGFNAGAGLAVIATLAAGLTLPMPLVAAAGGVAAALLVAVLGHRKGQADTALTLILVGLGVGFTATGLATFLSLTISDALAIEARRWITGSLAARSWLHAGQVWGMGLVLCLLLAVQARALGLLELGRDLATGLGLNAARARAGLLATGVLLAAAGVAVAGPVPFVALMAGPLGRGLTGARSPALRLAAAAGAGAAIMAAADLVARSALPGIQFPVGVMTGILGAPYLLWLLSRAFGKGEA